jgi:Na+-transporting NADH:ubiquinone oxidoreductase subunit B
MKLLTAFLDRWRLRFTGPGRYQRFGALFSFLDQLLYSPAVASRSAPWIHSGLNGQRVFAGWCLALLPCTLFALWNCGYQANLVIAAQGLPQQPGWQSTLLQNAGLGFDPGALWGSMAHGLLYFLPLLLTSLVVALFWEALFATLRRRPMDEGFIVTSLLFTLTLPPTLPPWQAAIGISFAIVIAKQLFGGTGMNFLNPALAGRAFLYFACPGDISATGRWIAVDGNTAATPLGLASDQSIIDISQNAVSWTDAALGAIPGAMGETSVIACLLGALVLLMLRLASWRVMLGSLVGLIIATLVLNSLGATRGPMWSMPWHWHLVLGGYAFGTIFMATDPVSSSQTNTGRWCYGILIGLLTVLIRVTNPLFPEGIMMAILFANVCAPLIDHFVIAANVRRRQRRHAL